MILYMLCYDMISCDIICEMMRYKRYDIYHVMLYIISYISDTCIDDMMIGYMIYNMIVRCIRFYI